MAAVGAATLAFVLGDALGYMVACILGGGVSGAVCKKWIGFLVGFCSGLLICLTTIAIAAAVAPPPPFIHSF